MSRLLLLLVAGSFPSDLLGRLLVQETADGGVVEVHGTTDEEGVEDGRCMDFAWLRGIVY